MTPVAIVPHSLATRERYLASNNGSTSAFETEFNLRESDTDASALQPVKEPQEDDWNGIQDRNETSSDSEESGNGGYDMKIDGEERAKLKPVLPKDAEEEELERMIFGDSAGFKERVEKFSLGGRPASDSSGSKNSEVEPASLAYILDQDLFFFDSGTLPVPLSSASSNKPKQSEDESPKPAWEDSDDERLVVSLASVPQLKKLRENAEDDLINGKEYSKRLRIQYQRLYPTPQWALDATNARRKKRRQTLGDDGSEATSASDMDVDEDDLSTHPLAKLLKDADILSQTSKFAGKHRKLQAGKIDIQHLTYVGKKRNSMTTSLSFHPNLPLLLASGPGSTVYLYHVNLNQTSSKSLLTSLHVKSTPLITTTFHPLSSDSRIFLGARRRYFHVWNITTGKVEKISRIYGHQYEQRTMEHFSLSPDGRYMAFRGSSRKGGGVINVLDATTLQWVTQARIESRGGIADFAWWRNGKGMTIVGKNGEVTEWSAEDGILGRWLDEGAVGTTVIALGGTYKGNSSLGGDRWVAVGSSSGVVNLYDRSTWKSATLSECSGDGSNYGIPPAPQPLRDLQNLTTSISHLHFSPDGQILVMASQWKQDAIRLVHLPSATVFSNWPREKTGLGRITAVAWSRPSIEDEQEGSLAQLAIANEAGHIRLWDIRV